MDMLFVVGILTIIGFAGGKFGKILKLPAVVGYLIAGIMLGPSLFNFVRLDTLPRMELISDFALGIVAFSIGNTLRLAVLKRMGWGIIIIILAESLFAFFMVAGAVYLLTGKMYIALIFGALAPASAPAGTWVVLKEYRAKGPLTDTILAVVGLDDGLAILIYGFASAMAKTLISGEGKLSLTSIIMMPVFENMGAIALGVVLGLIFIYVMRKFNNKNDFLVISVGIIMICTGLSNIFKVSVILSNMSLGMIMANTYLFTSKKSFEAIDNITAPIYVIFFVIAGAHLQIQLLLGMGVLGVVYIVFRSLGLISGAYVGAVLAKANDNVRKYLGLSILSQAGVAIGLAILVGKEFGELGDAGRYISVLAINTIAATTIFFEFVGPLTTKYAITKSGEAGKQNRR